MSQEPRQPPRQPPQFVPTLTQMVPPFDGAKAEPAPVASAAMPAAFAELLKDWPSLGEPTPAAELAEQAPGPAAFGADQRGEDVNAEPHVDRHAERIAQRAEALVLQRLPALMAGLVSQAVRDATAEVAASDRENSSLDKSI